MNRCLRYLALPALVMLSLTVACSDDTASGTNSNTGANATTNAGTNAGTNANTGGNTSAGNTAAGNTAAGNTSAGGDMGMVASDMDPFNNADLPFEQNPQGMVLCGDVPCACNDGMDNDGDGLVDGFDPECTGPFDDDEATFATGIPGDNKDTKKQDCFFDGDSGAGNDGCDYDGGCQTGDIPPDDPRCQVTQECIDFCGAYSPNGCDCFGCCEIFRDDGTSKKVLIGSECSVDKLDDETVCSPCEQTEQCGNSCGRCELCLGKTLEDLPEDCFPSTNPDPNDMGTPGEDMGTPAPDMENPQDPDMGTPPPTPFTCDGDFEPCDAQGQCNQGINYYCIQGCCIEYAG
jgi:hypothetical protein